jgi:hypothetical protein
MARRPWAPATWLRLFDVEESAVDPQIKVDADLDADRVAALEGLQRSHRSPHLAPFPPPASSSQGVTPEAPVGRRFSPQPPCGLPTPEVIARETLRTHQNDCAAPTPKTADRLDDRIVLR